ncbi:signal peptidase II [Clostridium tetanomorphum]|uniref:signal peptidase II n=1 Tax=Clostridium tetanomorphum TaxID=1553 RepID=UPI00044AC8CF|nr:signal peptidase II [Clostridium tetanomorphum]KAJ53406.1 lipoprotein signal peptidase [Clostridium tetanomorphum DSM 665]MBP1863937.1 signal peptidase II [Clostridium tetanomorphum]NRS85015.1 signal peptidase II [Clostridium tetanomorphum]SQB91459.1 lipoprotein signal peptidase [Clostridium tetanomorphum]
MELTIIILGIILDRLTKIWATKELSSGENIVIIKDFFQFSYLENNGAAFGIFRDKSVFLITITLVVVIGIIVYLFRYKPQSKLLRMSLAFVISGAIGNLIDRIQYKYVVDFISLHYKDAYYFPIFNIADILVTLGTLLLALFVIKEDEYGEKRIFNK